MPQRGAVSCGKISAYIHTAESSCTSDTPTFGSDFEPYSLPNDFTKTFTGIVHISGVGGYQTQIRDIPRGARITEVAIMFVKGASGRNLTMTLYSLRADDGFTVLGTITNNAAAVSTAEQVMNIATTNSNDFIIDEAASTHWLVTEMSPLAELRSVRIGWTSPSVGPLIPIAPKRVYDSRFTAPLGPAGGRSQPGRVGRQRRCQ